MKDFRSENNIKNLLENHSEITDKPIEIKLIGNQIG